MFLLSRALKIDDAIVKHLKFVSCALEVVHWTNFIFLWTVWLIGDPTTFSEEKKKKD